MLLVLSDAYDGIWRPPVDSPHKEIATQGFDAFFHDHLKHFWTNSQDTGDSKGHDAHVTSALWTPTSRKVHF